MNTSKKKNAGQFNNICHQLLPWTLMLGGFFCFVLAKSDQQSLIGAVFEMGGLILFNIQWMLDQSKPVVGTSSSPLDPLHKAQQLTVIAALTYYSVAIRANESVQININSHPAFALIPNLTLEQIDHLIDDLWKTI